MRYQAFTLSLLAATLAVMIPLLRRGSWNLSVDKALIKPGRETS